MGYILKPPILGKEQARLVMDVSGPPVCTGRIIARLSGGRGGRGGRGGVAGPCGARGMMDHAVGLSAFHHTTSYCITASTNCGLKFLFGRKTIE
ncbi:hypothetical protein JYU34_020769 [Plutella xylostella]|uniref:Uncharacterized protein n=1 Tax=Plutella xylostella TaxID=51655 RepID=A0ABQ7PRX5_PLUXY|nr:hypothetical protein JYU34_020769 [Plutella xylostella]